MEFMNSSAVNLLATEASTNITTSESAFVRLKIFEFFLMSCHFLFGLPINCYVTWLIVKGTGSGVASEFIILNLSVSEILFSLDSLISILATTIKSQWLGSLAVFFQGLGITSHPLFQCLMCVERYLAVVHPVTFLNYKPLRYRVICCTTAWIATFASCLFCLFTNSDTYSWFLSVHILIIFFIQLFCLVAVLRALKQSGPGVRKKDKEENHIKRRAFYLILITTLNIVIINLPSTIVALITVVTHQHIPAILYFSFVCFTLAGYVQPVLYLHQTGKLCFSCSKK